MPRKKKVEITEELTPITQQEIVITAENEQGGIEQEPIVVIAEKPVVKSKKESPTTADFKRLNTHELDKDLTPAQMQEWNDIYASYKSRSVLSGVVIGVDEHNFKITNKETGEAEQLHIRSLVVINYRVKVIIPFTEIFLDDTTPEYVAKGMIGAKIDYVITNIDRVGECAVASRKLAVRKIQRMFTSQNHGNKIGDTVKCRLLVVGPKKVLAECHGFDMVLTQRDITYTAIADLRTDYEPGQEFDSKIMEFNSAENKLKVSIKETNPNPFDGAEIRNPVSCRRSAVISGKYKGGVFCRMPDNTQCLCLYSNMHADSDFLIGDKVIVYITKYDYSKKLIFGRIAAKW